MPPPNKARYSFSRDLDHCAILFELAYATFEKPLEFCPVKRALIVLVSFLEHVVGVLKIKAECNHSSLHKVLGRGAGSQRV
jgi:hypothetical protein